MMMVEHVVDLLPEGSLLLLMHMHFFQEDGCRILTHSGGRDNLSGCACGGDLFDDFDLLRDLALDNGRADNFVLDDSPRLLFEDLRSLAFLFDDVLVGLVDDWFVLLVDHLLLPLVDNRLMNLVHHLLINHRLVMLMNYLLVVLMHHILVVLMDDVFVVLVDHVSVQLLDDGRIHVHFDAGSHCIAVDYQALHVSFDNGRLFVANHSSLGK